MPRRSSGWEKAGGCGPGPLCSQLLKLKDAFSAEPISKSKRGGREDSDAGDGHAYHDADPAVRLPWLWRCTAF